MSEPAEAFEIILADSFDPENRGDGWCFSLPPGITSTQWPLSPATGFALTHNFTIKLPPSYRPYGDEFVALSLFSDFSQFTDGPDRGLIDDERWEALATIFRSRDGHESAPDYLKVFAEHKQQAHPHCTQFRDSLWRDCAVIMLTEDEFAGDLCTPPEFQHEMLRHSNRPEWLDTGWAYEYAALAGWHLAVADPEPELAFGVAIHLTPFADPNAGMYPSDVGPGEVSDDGYSSKWHRDESGSLVEQPWFKPDVGCHIGGTARPIQQTPEMSPFFIGIGEYFGGFNFGTGNAQLDFEEMDLHWSC